MHSGSMAARFKRALLLAGGRAAAAGRGALHLPDGDPTAGRRMQQSLIWVCPWRKAPLESLLKEFLILQTSGNWYKAELNGCEGFVPKNFITIHLPSWYEEDSSRSDAQEKLLQQPTGAFIIRGSQNSAQGRFAISVRQAEDVQHFKVLRDSRGQYYLWSEKFPSLNQMVEYYKNNSISKHSPVFLQEMKQQPVGDLLTGPNQRRGPLPAPPLSSSPPTPEPRTRQVRALYCFNAEETDELQFNAGDVITVLENSDEAWWRGQLRGKTGLFPSNFTKPI